MSLVTTEPNVIDFDGLTPKSVSIYNLLGKNYTLKEAKAEAARVYRNAKMSCMKYGIDGKLVSIQNLADIEPLLVSLTLFDEKDKPVPLQTIKTWPSRVVTKLHNEAKRISDLDEKNPDRDALEKVLGLEGAPVEFSALHEFIESREEPDYQSLKAWMASNTAEDNAKNGQSATPATSD